MAGNEQKEKIRKAATQTILQNNLMQPMNFNPAAALVNSYAPDQNTSLAMALNPKAAKPTIAAPVVKPDAMTGYVDDLNKKAIEQFPVTDSISPQGGRILSDASGMQSGGNKQTIGRGLGEEYPNDQLAAMETKSNRDRMREALETNMKRGFWGDIIQSSTGRPSTMYSDRALALNDAYEKMGNLDESKNPLSNTSKLYQEQGAALGLPVTRNMNAFDIKEMMDGALKKYGIDMSMFSKVKPGGSGNDPRLNILGYARDPNIQSKPEVVADLRKAQGSVKGLQDNINKLLGLQQKHGNFEVLDSEARGRMENLMKQIQIDYKEAAKLGALTGPDMGLIEEAIGTSPTSWTNIFEREGTTRARLKSALDSVNAANERSLREAGYLRQEEQPLYLEKDGKRYKKNATGKYEEVR